MTYNPSVLREALRARSLTQDQLSERLGIARSRLEQELDRDPQPRQPVLNAIARELSLPPFVFYMRRPPPLHEIIPDFRSANPSPRAKSRETIRSIIFAEGVQRAAERDQGDTLRLPPFNVTKINSVDTIALDARTYFNITLEDQVTAKDARHFYLICRKKIEEKGIFVLHDTFPSEDGSGFCLSHSTHPIVVVNTKNQTRGRRLFTLVHELAHVLMGRSGISDPFVRSNNTERLANRFAGSFLVPRSFAPSLLGRAVSNDPGYEDVRWASRRLKISQEATALRLEQINLYKEGSYSKWKSLVHNSNPDLFERTGGRGGPPPQEKVKLSRYGFSFAKTFGKLLSEGLITQTNIYRTSGLKPEYQESYFKYAQSLTANELQELELEDD